MGSLQERHPMTTTGFKKKGIRHSKTYKIVEKLNLALL